MNRNDDNIPENAGLNISADSDGTTAQKLDEETEEIYVACAIVNRLSNGFSNISSYNHKTLNQLEIRSNDRRAAILLHMSQCLSSCAQNQIDLEKLLLSQFLVRQKNDTQNLARTYYYVLTGWELDELEKNCEDPHSAKDLITKITSGYICEIEEVLKHPFHWSEKKKINFICQAFDIVYPDYEFGQPGPTGSTGPARPNLKEGVGRNNKGKHDLDDGTDILPEYGWLEDIKLKDDELDMRNEHTLVTVDKVYVETKTIFNTAFSQRTGKEKFTKDSILDLLRFFRNYHVHYWGNGQAVQLAFGGYSKCYWKFYHTRFPKLLIHVYNKMKNCMHGDNALEEDFF